MQRIAAAFMGLVALVCSSAARADAPASSTGFVEVPGGSLYVEECGSGPAIVLLHDGLLDSAVWDEVWRPLCASHHVVRYDRRGYGRSKPAQAPFSAEDDLAAIMQHAHMARAALVGSSSGTGLALDFTLAHPDRVEALVLVGPVVHGMRSSDFFTRRGDAANAPLAKGDAKGAAENWSKDRYQVSGDKPEARARILAILTARPQNLTVPGRYEARLSPPTVARLSAIEAPTLAIMGADDIADVHAFSGAIQAALPVARREVWAGDGHLVELEEPQKLAARIESFLAVAERRVVDVPVQRLRGDEGTYSLGGSPARVALVGKRLGLRINNEADIPLFAEPNGRFLVRTSGTEIEFERTGGAKASAMLIRNPGSDAPIRCPRMS